MEPIPELLDVRAQRLKPPHQGADAVAFLDVKLSGAGHVQVAALSGPCRQRGNLVDQQRHFVRPEPIGRGVAALIGTRPRFTARFALDPRVDERAPPAQHVEERDTRRIEPDVFDFHLRARKRGGRRQPERRGGNIARHDESARR